MRRAQTSTEYMILVAVVIVIAVVVSSILGDFPGMGSGTTKKVDDYKLSIAKVGVEDYANFTNYSLIKIKNNHFDTLVADAVNVNGYDCNDSNDRLPVTLKVGQSITLNCSVAFEGTPNINIIWTDVITGASYATSENATSINSLAESSSPEECNALDSTGDQAGVFYNGDGSLSSPYGICNCTMLQNMSLNLTANYQLLSDIDCSDTVNWNGGKGFNPLGCEDSYCGTRTVGTFFSGTFDGNYYTIYNFTIKRESGWERDLGLFGFAKNAEIKETIMDGGYVEGGHYSGILVGSMNNTRVYQCKTNTSMNTGDGWTEGMHMGTLIGSARQGSVIEQCFGTGDINIVHISGGLVGSLVDDSYIIDSYATGDSRADRDHAGGLVGHVSDSYVVRSYALGSATAVYYMVGGLVGSLYEKFSKEGVPSINDSFAIGAVSGDTRNYEGGLLGALPYTEPSYVWKWPPQPTHISNSYFSYDAARDFGILAASSQFQGLTPGEPVVSWDTTNVWQLNAGTYPTLKWYEDLE